MKRNIFTLVVLANSIVGCSNEQVYTAVQSNRQLECQKLPRGQYEECMKQYDQSYGTYAEDREEVLEDRQ